MEWKGMERGGKKGRLLKGMRLGKGQIRKQREYDRKPQRSLKGGATVKIN